MSAARGEHGFLDDSRLLGGLPSVVAAAHEMKSPLALIRQLSMTLESEEISNYDRARILQQISLTSEKALRLTSDLTRSANLAGAMFKLEPINPYQVCEDIVKEMQPLYQAYGRKLYLLNRKSPLLMVANRDLLRRILTNFSDNALHYTDSDLPIEIKIHARGNMIRLGVRDYGPSLTKGLTHEVRSGLNGANQLNARPQSSGLGLFIVSQFAEFMNGKIGCVRHRNGTTFYVDLHASRQLNLL